MPSCIYGEAEKLLVAKLNDQFINAFDACQGKNYCCPACGEHLVLKQGQSKIAHFAHQVNSGCVLREGESYEHLLGKQQIFEWARKKGWQAELEVYIPQLEQRADVLLRIGGQRIVIEFQCSPLSLTALQKRTFGYQSIGIKCYWFLGSPYKRKLNQRQAQKFVQIVNRQYTIIFWDIKAKIFRLVKLAIKEKPLSLKGVTRDYRILHRLSLLQEINPCVKKFTGGLPVICHQKIWGIQVTNHPEIYWRCLVVKRLNEIPLFTSFSLNSWLYLLKAVGLTEWVKFPCLPSSRIINDYLKVFTKQLLKSGIIMMDGQTIILIRHPSYHRSLMNQYQEIQRLIQ